MGTHEQAERRAGYVLILIFVLLAAGIVTAGSLSYRSYEKRYRAEVERQLSAIAELKVGELAQWRRERLGDAGIIYRNAAFTALAARVFTNPQDAEAHRQLQAWMSAYPTHGQYHQVRLLDARGGTLMSVPAGRPPAASAIAQRIPDALRSGQVTIVDFYRHEHDQRIYLTVLVPILDEQDGDRAIGILALTKRLVEVHGGRIWVESADPGKGATFRFTLATTRRHPI
jgi:hypothetical protein